MGQVSARHLILLLIFLAVSIGPPSPAHALPPGRSWVPITRQSVPGYDYVASPVIEIDGTGIPIMLGNARLLSGGMKDAVLYRWGGGAWGEAWRLGRGTSLVWPVLCPEGDPYLLWGGLETHDPAQNAAWLVLAQVSESGVTQADTVAERNVSSFEYAAAVGRKRRWTVLSDYFENLRLFYRDPLGPWNEVSVDGSGDFGVSVADLDSASALVVWAGLHEGLKWGLLSGTNWTPVAGQLASRAIRPQLRPRPSGGHWMSWATGNEFLGIREFVNGAWTPPESLSCAYLNSTAQHSTGQPEMTRDDREYPSIAWAYQSPTSGGTGLCVCMSSDTGFGQVEELPGTQGTNVPTMARDRNGDLWLAWWIYWDGIFWTHTYTTATTTTPRILSNRALRGISWMLSEPAPETWWAVLRSRNGGEYEQVARIRAGASPNMSWIDTSSGGGTLRYKIRRECVDTRYQWESPPGHWPPVATSPWTAPPIELGIRVVTGSRSELEVTGTGTAPIEIELFDLQGRRVLSRRIGSETDTVRFQVEDNSTPLAPGIYFARARDDSGRVSDPAKLVLLR